MIVSIVFDLVLIIKSIDVKMIFKIRKRNMIINILMRMSKLLFLFFYLYKEIIRVKFDE